MRRRIEIVETVIAPGAIVRLERATRLSMRMARWEVLETTEDSAKVRDVEDPLDVRWFALEDLERVSGGTEVVKGHEYVYEPDFLSGVEDELLDDLYDDGDVEDTEYPGSLLDDPDAVDDEQPDEPELDES